MPKKSLPSEVNSIWFHRAEGWTPTKAKAWVLSHFGVTAKKFVNRESAGGSVLAPGSYIDVKVAPSGRGFTSCGYKEISPKFPGVYFQICGYRPRPRTRTKSKASEQSQSRLSGYVIEYFLGNRPYESDILPTQAQAQRMMDELEYEGAHLTRLLEVDPETNEELVLWDSDWMRDY